MNTFQKMIDKAIEDQNGDFTPSQLAAQVLAEGRENDPQAVREWLDAISLAVVTETISKRLQSDRGVALARRGARAFQSAVDSGDPDELNAFRTYYAVNDENLRRRVADMTGPDHTFVANSYGRSARQSQMLEAFHRAVAKKVGPRRTEEVFTEEEYARLYSSVMGG